MRIIVLLIFNQIRLWWRKNLDNHSILLNIFKTTKNAYITIFIFLGLIATLIVLTNILILKALKISNNIQAMDYNQLFPVVFFLIFIFIFGNTFRVSKHFSQQQKDSLFLDILPISTKEILLSKTFAYSSIHIIAIWVITFLLALSVQITMSLSRQLLFCWIFFVGLYIVGTVLLRDILAILLALCSSIIGQKINQLMSFISFILVLVITFLLSAVCTSFLFNFIGNELEIGVYKFITNIIITVINYFINYSDTFIWLSNNVIRSIEGNISWIKGALILSVIVIILNGIFSLILNKFGTILLLIKPVIQDDGNNHNKYLEKLFDYCERLFPFPIWVFIKKNIIQILRAPEFVKECSLMLILMAVFCGSFYSLINNDNIIYPIVKLINENWEEVFLLFFMMLIIFFCLNIISQTIVSVTSPNSEGRNIDLLFCLPIRNSVFIIGKIVIHFIILLTAGILLDILVIFIFNTSWFYFLTIIIFTFCCSASMAVITIGANAILPCFDWINKAEIKGSFRAMIFETILNCVYWMMLVGAVALPVVLEKIKIIRFSLAGEMIVNILLIIIISLILIRGMWCLIDSKWNGNS